MLVVELTDIITAVASVFAAGAVIFGVYQYKTDQINRRKDVLFDLINEFDNDSHEMLIAKTMLDGFRYSRGYWENPQIDYAEYGIDQPLIFRDHKSSPIYDDGEVKIRDSFDSLLDFFGKLGYLLEVGLLKDNEIQYFKYYIELTIKSKNVGLYLNTYNFQLYHKLLARLGFVQAGYEPKTKQN